MASNGKAYTIQPVITVEGNDKTTEFVYVKQFQIKVEDHQWHEDEFYNDLEKIVKTDVLPHEMPFKHMKSFENIKHDSLFYILGKKEKISFLTQTSLMSIFKEKDILHADQPIKLYLFYKIEEREKGVWNSFLLNLKLEKASIEKKEQFKDGSQLESTHYSTCNNS